MVFLVFCCHFLIFYFFLMFPRSFPYYHFFSLKCFFQNFFNNIEFLSTILLILVFQKSLPRNSLTALIFFSNFSTFRKVVETAVWPTILLPNITLYSLSKLHAPSYVFNFLLMFYDKVTFSFCKLVGYLFLIQDY